MGRGVGMGAALVLAVMPVGVAEAAGPTGVASVTYFDGIPGADTDFYSNGQLLGSSVKPGSFAQTVALKPGMHNLRIYRSGVDPEASAPMATARVRLSPGADLTVAGFLDAAGHKQMKVFSNTYPAPARPRLVVRHLAEMDTVDVNVNGRTAMENLDNGLSVSALAATGAATVQPVLAGTQTSAGAGVKVPLKARATTTVLLWGARGSVKAVPLRTTRVPIPSRVPAGDATVSAGRWNAPGLLAGGVGAVGVSLWLIRRSAA